MILLERKPRLLEQVRTVARVRHLSLKTEEAYVSRIKHFILFHKKRHPLEMGGWVLQTHRVDRIIIKDLFTVNSDSVLKLA